MLSFQYYYELPFKKDVKIKKLDIKEAPIVSNIKLIEYNESDKCFIGEII